jgi:hypothetical protein
MGLQYRAHFGAFFFVLKLWKTCQVLQDVPRPASAPGSAGPTATLGSGGDEVSQVVRYLAHMYIYNINVCIYIYIQYIYIHTIYIYGCIEKRDYQFVWQFEKNCDLPIIARAVEEQVCRRPLWKIKTLVSGEEKALQVWTLPALRTWLCGDHTLMCHFYVIAMAIKTTCYIPSGKHTKSYWKWPFIVDFPINSMVIFHSYVKLPEGTIYVCK